MHAPGFLELLLIFGVVVLLFGGKKLPSLGLALGEGIKNFKKGMKEIEDDKTAAAPTTPAQATPVPQQQLPKSSTIVDVTPEKVVNLSTDNERKS